MSKTEYSVLTEQRSRFRLVSVFIVFLALAILVKLFYLQVFKHGYYVKMASGQHWARDVIPANRGKIYVKDDMTGGLYPLATNKTLSLVFASPEEIKDKGLVARRLAPIIGVEEIKLRGLIENNHTYVPLKHQLSYEQSDKVKELKLDGIYLSPEQVRYYPEGSLASQVLGYVDSEGKGRYGLEQYFDDDLSGIPGLYKAEISPSGKKIAFGNNVSVEPKDGDDVVLSINRDIQQQAEKLIKASVDKFQAENGSIIVEKPDTGEIVAMANYPTFDPNNYKDVKDYKTFGNAAVADEYEPGSIFKVITMAMGLDTKKVQPDSKYEDTGKVNLNGHTIMNSDKKAHGLVNMTYVLEQSLNTGTVYVLNQIGKNVFFDYLKKFGLGVATGIEQPVEGIGSIYAPNTVGVNDHTYATMTFGQSISTTPIQMVAAFAAIANHGVLVKPHLVAEKRSKDGKISKVKTEKVGQVMSDEAAAKELQMLVAVVEKGHGQQAKVAGYKIGGKTGTAQVPLKNGLGYDPNRNIGSFIGIGPIENPQYVVMAKVDAPKGIPWAESSAAPVVGQMMDFLMKYYQVPPTVK